MEGCQALFSNIIFFLLLTDSRPVEKLTVSTISNTPPPVSAVLFVCFPYGSVDSELLGAMKGQESYPLSWHPGLQVREQEAQGLAWGLMVGLSQGRRTLPTATSSSWLSPRGFPARIADRNLVWATLRYQVWCGGRLCLFICLLYFESRVL